MIPAVRPWDLAFDESNNVLTNGWIIFWLVSLGRLVWVHLGMPCQSFTKDAAGATQGLAVAKRDPKFGDLETGVD